jgi:hypothetical protein
VLLSVLLSLATLWSGFFLDDYQQRIALLTDDHANVFEFFHRGTATSEAQMQQGVLPWWTRDALKSYDIIAWQLDHFVAAKLPPIGEQTSIRTDASCLWCKNRG